MTELENGTPDNGNKKKKEAALKCYTRSCLAK